MVEYLLALFLGCLGCVSGHAKKLLTATNRNNQEAVPLLVAESSVERRASGTWKATACVLTIFKEGFRVGVGRRCRWRSEHFLVD